MSSLGGGQGQPSGWSRQGNAQMEQGGITPGERLRSVTTTGGHTSGAHEVIPTNVQREATFQGFSPGIQLTLSSARTDTARTVMSGSGGQAAGHTHSQQPTQGQANAHDQNRNAFAAWATDNSAGPHTEQEAAVFAGALAVASMAPAAVARANNLDGGVRDQEAAKTWEADREESKARVNKGFSELPQQQQTRVVGAMQGFMTGVSGPQGSTTERQLAPGVPTSPRRDTTQTSGNGFLTGGAYSGSPPVATQLSGTTGPERSSEMTQPFRRTKV